jgi:hypothetical protein
MCLFLQLKMVKDQLNLATFQNLGEHFFEQEMGVDFIHDNFIHDTSVRVGWFL